MCPEVSVLSLNVLIRGLIGTVVFILFDAIVNETAFLISFFTAMYRTTIGFCILILYPVLFIV